MKLIRSILLVAVALAIVKVYARAADTASTAKDIAALFPGNELSIETAYTARTEDLVKFSDSTTVGFNYFALPGAGVHAGIGLNDFNDQGVDLVEFGLLGRVPFEKIRTAIQFGIGAEYRFVNSRGSYETDEKKPKVIPALEDSWAVYAEVGPVIRLHKHLDIFAKVRGVRPVKSAVGEHIAIIAGIDIPFSF